jgi:hypothetical protein
LGTSDEQLEALFSSSAVSKDFCVETDDGELLYATVSAWDVSLVDTSQVGSYRPLTITLPPGVAFADDAELDLYATVNVIDPDTVDLRTFVRNFNGVIDLYWLIEPAEPTVWMKTDDGEFELAPENVSTFAISSSTDFLTIYEWNLDSGSIYTFQVRYENGGVSVNNFVIDLTGTRPVYSTIGGDRDGGDRGPLTGTRPPTPNTGGEGTQTGGADTGSGNGEDGTGGDEQDDSTNGLTGIGTIGNPLIAVFPQPAVWRPGTLSTQQAPYAVSPIPLQPENSRPEVQVNPVQSDAATNNSTTTQEARITDAVTPLAATLGESASTDQSLPLLPIAGGLAVIAFAGIAYLVVMKTVRIRLR